MTSTHSLNLLPPEDQQRVGRDRLIRFFTYTNSVIFIILLVGNTLLLPTYFFLFFQERGARELLAAQQQTAHTEQTRETEARITQINAALARFQKSYTPAKDSLAASITSSITNAPAGITLSFFSFEKETGAIILRGHALTRNDLLQYISLIREHPSFSRVESPVENILRDKNISFTLSFSIRNEKKHD